MGSKDGRLNNPRLTASTITEAFYPLKTTFSHYINVTSLYKISNYWAYSSPVKLYINKCIRKNSNDNKRNWKLKYFLENEFLQIAV